MKNYLILLLLTCTGLFADAQTWPEWFRQKKTQITYLSTQIAALKVYSDYVAKGYAVAKSGLTTIGVTKRNDLSMHDDYFASLRRVNPRVKNYYKVGGIIAMQIKMVKGYHQQQRAAISSSHLTRGERKYINKTLGQLLLGCADLIGQLLMVTTDYSIQMKDAERLERIDQLFSDMQERAAFLQSFGAQTRILIFQRMREAVDINTSRSLRSIH